MLHPLSLNNGVDDGDIEAVVAYFLYLVAKLIVFFVIT